MYSIAHPNRTLILGLRHDGTVHVDCDAVWRAQRLHSTLPEVLACDDSLQAVVLLTPVFEPDTRTLRWVEQARADR